MIYILFYIFHVIIKEKDVEAMNRKRRVQLFESKIEPEYKRVFCFIYSRVNKDKELTKDITQNVMENAWLKIEQIRNEESIRAWLMQIAINEVKKYFRMQNAQKRSLFDEESYEAHQSGISKSIEQIEEDVLDQIIIKEKEVLLMKALDNVPEKYQTLIDLRLLQDLKFNEIAEIMQIDSAHVRVYYKRGLMLLYKEYSQLLKGDIE